MFENGKAFETWLRQHHASSEDLWSRIAKQGALEHSVTCAQALELAPCWGWTDDLK